MGSVVIAYKIFPVDITVSFDDLKKKIEKSLPEFASVYGYGEEPIAFGLKALLVQIKFPEDKTGVLEEFEKKLEAIGEISQVQTIMVRRISR
ncbi:MAG: elongation factor 1-beta [Candidatus Bathycorpusculaceae bacterium]